MREPGALEYSSGSQVHRYAAPVAGTFAYSPSYHTLSSPSTHKKQNALDTHHTLCYNVRDNQEVRRTVPKVKYQEHAFGAKGLLIIKQANEIIAQYAAQGYVLTLRQLYYQFVSRDLIANKVTEYKRLGSIINDARLAGLIDWHSIEDRTRNLAAMPHWDGPESIVSACAAQFAIDKWDRQPLRIEVWIEKEALAGVFERICRDLDVPYLSCRGYTSQSEMWVASQRVLQHCRKGQLVHILHFGDHDPSGLDMTRDIQDRLRIFGCDMKLERLALNMDQVERYAPPPNPAKETDSRFAGYIERFGGESWELDALEPSVLSDLVRARVYALRDLNLWESAIAEEDEHKRLLKAASSKWAEVVAFLEE